MRVDTVGTGGSPAAHRRSGPVANPTRPVPADRSPRVKELIAAARLLLEAEGEESLTMRRLAEAVGIRAPSIYKHFDGKAGVEVGLVEDGLFESGDTLHRAVEDPDPAGPSRPSWPPTGRWPPGIPTSTD